MKRTTLLLTFAVLALFGASAKADLITSFSFDAGTIISTLPAGGNFGTTFRSSSGALTNTAAFQSFPDGSFVNPSTPAISGQSAGFNSNLTPTSSSVTFSVDFTKFSNLQLVINYNENSGPTQFTVTAQGTGFSTVVNTPPTGSGFGSVTVNIPAASSMITFTSFSPFGAGVGGIYFDNISFLGTPTGVVPEPTNVALGVFGLGLVGMVAFRRRNSASEELEVASV